MQGAPHTKVPSTQRATTALAWGACCGPADVVVQGASCDGDMVLLIRLI